MAEDPTKEGTIEINTEDGVGTVTFGHPKSNSLPAALLQKVADAIQDCSDDASVRVILLKTTGEKAFCAGASFDEFLAVSNLDESKACFGGFAKIINAIRKSSKLVVARVQGKVVGGGVGIVAASDYAIATEASAAKLSEIQLGIGPFIIGPAVQRKIGLPAFGIMGADAEWKTPEWCLDKCLYSKVTKDISELDKEVSELCQRFAKFNPDATLHLKKILWEGTENWDALLQERVGITAELALTDFVQSTIQSLKAK